MQTELFSVSKIFTENLFRIPDYQRGYSWSDKQLRDFWNDLDQLENGKDHYAGVLTLEETPSEDYKKWEDDLWIIESKRFSPFYVVDGQQRLTTTIILIQCLLDKLKKSEQLNFTQKTKIQEKYIFETKDKGISRSYIFGYDKDNPSYEFLKVRIFQEVSDKHSTIEETIYTQNLSYAQNFFMEKIKPLSREDLENVYTKLTQHFLFNIYTITKEIDVFVTFETMNNRGKLLSNLELLKNRLIYLSTKLPEDSTETGRLRKTINESWKSAYHYLGRNKKRLLNDNVFLRLHFFLYFLPKLKEWDGDIAKELIVRYRHYEDEYKEYLLEKIFTTRALLKPSKKEAILSVKFIHEYAQDLKRCVGIFYEIHSPEDSPLSDDEKVLLTKNQRISPFEATMLIMAVFSKSRNTTKKRAFLKLLEQFLFISSISMMVRRTGRIRLEELASQVYSGDMTIELVNKELTKAVTQAKKDADFSRIFADWGRTGFYAWHGIRYFMFEYEQHLLAQSKTKREKLTWEEFIKEDYAEEYTSVEHIYPQKAEDTEWPKAFDGYTPREKNAIKNSVGNLIPLSKPKNSSLGRKGFNIKKGSATKKIGYAYGCYTEIEVAQNKQWTAREILLRGLKLLEFMESRWSIKIGDNEAKIKALGLGFVIKKEPKLAVELNIQKEIK